MGNAHVSQKQGNRDYGRIFIRTDKPFYFAGEVVTGNIYLFIEKEGFPGTTVFLRVSGKEKCRWTEESSETDSEGKSQTKTDVYTGKNTIYCHKIVRHQFQTQYLPMGQFSFPFQFQLMNHLPGSFEEKSGCEALIKYSVKAEIESSNKNIQNIKDQQELVLREPLKANIESLKGEIRAKATTCCCIDEGSCYISAVFDKNTYLPGETAFLQIEVDNSRCKLKINRIEATLKNNLTLSDGVRQRFFPQIVSRSQIGGLLAGQQAIGNNRLQMKVHLFDQYPTKAIKPSSNGSLVRSVYELSVTAFLNQCTCCAKNPEVNVPITIIAPVNMDSNAPPTEPPNWNPQVFDSQLIFLNNIDLNVKSQNKGMDLQMAKPYM